MDNQYDPQLVSSCGLYCGACSRYLKNRCPGCAENEKATWCKIRSCTRKSGYLTCAECSTYRNVKECRKFNTFFSKIFSLIFRSDRQASLNRIAEIGVEKYAAEMAQQQQPVIKRQ